MNKTIKYLSIFILTVIVTTVAGLELDLEIKTYLAMYLMVGGLISYIFIYKKPIALDIVLIPIILFSFFVTYILSASIIMYETDLAYSKITSIPKDKLIEYYKTQDINSIPEDKRHAWIGIFYREIDIVKKNRIRSIKAVGWKGHSVFAYYDIIEDDYSGSYH